MFDSEHARPFVFGMNGTFSGTFIPQMIPLDAFASPALLELAAQPEMPSALNLSQFVALRSELSADDFVVAATPQHMGPSAHVLPDFIDSTFSIHISKEYDKIFGAPYATLVSGLLILLVEYYILHWMYKKKIFLKV